MFVDLWIGGRIDGERHWNVRSRPRASVGQAEHAERLLVPVRRLFDPAQVISRTLRVFTGPFCCSQFTVDPYLSPLDRHPNKFRLGRAGRDGFADLELPFPQSRLKLRNGKAYAAMLHDLGGTAAPFASSSASSFKITLRWASS